MDTGRVSPATCAELRRAASQGRQLRQLADDYRLSYELVKRHVWGQCEHAVDVPPMPIE